jgi:hypothetical protein
MPLYSGRQGNLSYGIAGLRDLRLSFEELNKTAFELCADAEEVQQMLAGCTTKAWSGI